MSDFNFCKMIKANYYSYSGWWSVWWSGTYSMILSKAAFLHKKKYRSLYTNDMPASIREFTTNNRFSSLSLCSLSLQMLQTLLPYGLKVIFNRKKLFKLVFFSYDYDNL
ncbi:unnamed protein product [Brassica rapa subsp. trilocularis]